LLGRFGWLGSRQLKKGDKDGVTANMMDATIRDRVIDDLLRKIPQISYSDTMLFKLGLHAKFEIENYICSRFFYGKAKILLRRQKGTVTRRCNRLGARILPAVQRVQQAGGKGIYRIFTSSFEPQGHVYAESIMEAKKLGEMFLLYSSHAAQSIRVRFISYSSPQSLVAYNTELITRLDKKLESHKQHIDTLTQKIEKISLIKSSLLLMQKHILATEK